MLPKTYIHYYSSLCKWLAQRDTSDPVSLIPAENGTMCLSVLYMSVVMCMQPRMGVCSQMFFLSPFGKAAHIWE